MMNAIAVSILASGALIAGADAYNGYQGRLQADCHVYAQTYQKVDPTTFESESEWKGRHSVEARKVVVKILNLSDDHKKYCAW